MKLQVESRRTITPANISDNSLHNVLLPLSAADLSMQPIHIKIMYAFEAPTPETTMLERGLAEVLSEFREWAGRLTADKDGRPAIELNDKGVVWVEATADGPLADVMPFNPSPFLHQLFPPIGNGVPELLLVQVSRFACGGLVIGVSWHHLVADGTAFFGFMNSWSQIVRGQPIHPVPVHDRSLLMARDPPSPTFDHAKYDILAAAAPQPCDQNSQIVMKGFHFSAELLKEIKESASQNAEKPYTRFESLLAHLWRCASVARGLKGEVVSRVAWGVDARNKLNPPLPFQYFGNAIFPACSETTVNELVESPLRFATNLVHSAIARMDDGYIRSAIDFLELHFRDGRKTVSSVLNPHLVAISAMNFPFYELDFGCGRPSYGAPLSSSATEGVIYLLPSYTKDGSVDVVISLLEKDMAKFEEICHKL